MNTALKEKLVNGYTHKLHIPQVFSEEEMLNRSSEFYNFMDKRRTVREFSDKPVPKEIIENIIKTASTAPSGAHKQPWTFVAISNPEMKKKMREAAENVEEENYDNRMSERWKEDLAPLGTDDNKAHIEDAPWIIVAFRRSFEFNEDGSKHNNYYVNESVGLACGFLISAIHNAGLVTLTHTPSPMKFLEKLLNRGENEKAFILFPVGYAKDPVYVPDLERKKLEEVAVFYE